MDDVRKNALDAFYLVFYFADPLRDGLFKHNDMFELAKELDDSIKEIQVNSRLHGLIQFKDVCAKSKSSEGQKCFANEFMELSSKMSKIRSGKEVNMTFPRFYDPAKDKFHFLPGSFGNITLVPQSRVVQEITSIRLAFILDASEENEKQRIKAKIWERTALNYVRQKNWGDGRFEVMAVNSMSLEEELVENVNSAVTYLWLSISSGKSTYVVCNFVKKYAFSFFSRCIHGS